MIDIAVYSEKEPVPICKIAERQSLSERYPDGECAAAGECVTKYVWRKINESINRTVDEMKRDTLVKESRQISGSDRSHAKKCDQ